MDASLRARLSDHARVSAEVRSFFSGRGWVEVDTPVLCPFLIPEPSIEVFATEYRPARGAARPMWLAPSPELWMKRLLGRGAGDIFQLARAFRNGDWGGPFHNPEFRLLEWYSVGRECADMVGVTEDLVAHLVDRGCCRGDPRRVAPPFARVSMAEAFARHAGIDLDACQETAALRRAARARGIDAGEDATWEQIFHLVFLQLVEPSFDPGRPRVVTDWPARVPTTARTRPGTPWAERWELFAGGVEVANCYTEETDPAVLAALVDAEDRRRAGAAARHEPDRGLAGAFPPGFPPCTGAALGLDRLEMLLRGEESLEGVILFPFSAILRPQSSQG